MRKFFCTASIFTGLLRGLWWSLTHGLKDSKGEIIPYLMLMLVALLGLGFLWRIWEAAYDLCDYLNERRSRN